MADAADIATEREFILRQEALARLRTARGAQQASRSTCEECGDPIPEARRAAVPGVRLCITCQKELEA